MLVFSELQLDTRICFGYYFVALDDGKIQRDTFPFLAS